jgi:hypothetical protein
VTRSSVPRWLSRRTITAAHHVVVGAIVHSILLQLAGGDLRSTGRSTEVMLQVVAAPALASQLVDGMRHNDAVVRMRSADAFEKASRKLPLLAQSWRAEILELLVPTAAKGSPLAPAPDRTAYRLVANTAPAGTASRVACPHQCKRHCAGLRLAGGGGTAPAAPNAAQYGGPATPASPCVPASGRKGPGAKAIAADGAPSGFPSGPRCQAPVSAEGLTDTVRARRGKCLPGFLHQARPERRGG